MMQTDTAIKISVRKRLMNMLSPGRRRHPTSKEKSKGGKRNRDNSRKDTSEVGKTSVSRDDNITSSSRDNSKTSPLREDGKTGPAKATEAKSPGLLRLKILKGSKIFGKKVLGAAYLNKAGDALMQAGDVFMQAGDTFMKAGLAGREALLQAGIAGRDAIMYAGQTGRDVFMQAGLAGRDAIMYAGQTGRDALLHGLTRFMPVFEADQTKADKESFPVVEEDGMLINYVKIIGDDEDKELAITLTDHLTPLEYEDTVDYYRNMSTTRHQLIKVVLVLSDLLAERKVDGVFEEWKKHVEKLEKDAKEWQRKCLVSHKLFETYRRIAHPRELERTLAFRLWNYIENCSEIFRVVRRYFCLCVSASD